VSREKYETTKKVARLMEGGTEATGPIPTEERDGYTRASLSKLHIAAHKGDEEARAKIDELYEKKFGK
jgi:hypothetical protein